jgi:hypothetical protein
MQNCATVAEWLGNERNTLGRGSAAGGGASAGAGGALGSVAAAAVAWLN